MSESDYLIALSTFPFIGPVRTELLLHYFKSAKKIWQATGAELAETGLNGKIVEGFIAHKNLFDLEKYLRKLKSFGIFAVTKNDKDYPANLRDIADAPYVLYVRGVLKKTDSRSVAVVGTRLMTGYGREVAQKFATELATLGITVVSGLALGVDATAQRAAINAGGRTISVLASGLDIISPLTNKSLALEFIKEKGAVISEYPLGHAPQAFDFPVRDRLISGLSKAVIVVEGRMKSGTFYTVKAAADQGRPVFAVPGPITSPASDAPNYLIQNGAKPLTKIRDVLEELDLQFKVDSEMVERVMPASPIEEKLLKILEGGTLHLDEVVRISGELTGEVSARLTIMEMKGMVKNLGGGIYRKL